MIPVAHRRGQRLYVVGLGKSGLSTWAALQAGGAEAVLWDDREATRQAAAARGANLADPSTIDWSGIDAVVLSPGIPLTHPEPHPVVKLARAADVPVIGDTELFVAELRASMPGAELVAVTGTNGKSTTTALIGHLLACAGLEAQVGGNIGSFAVLELKPAVNHCRYVIEFSSYQIDLTPSLRPDVSVFLNLSPDHLDRHGDFDSYAAVKTGIFAAQGPGDTLVLGADDAPTAAMAAKVPQGVRVVSISAEREVPGGVYCLGTRLIDATSGEPRAIADLAGLGPLRGVHNRQNAAAAAAVALLLGLDRGQIAAGMKTFAGLAHRIEEVARAGRVLIVNDSKATNAEAAEKALISFRDIYWIAGGLAKAGGIAPLRPHFGRIAKAYLYGAAAGDFAMTLGEDVPHDITVTLDAALEHALPDALASDAEAPVVLLSPACASFDQYPNFEVRGDAFRRAALDLVARYGREKGRL